MQEEVAVTELRKIWRGVDADLLARLRRHGGNDSGFVHEFLQNLDGRTKLQLTNSPPSERKEKAKQARVTQILRERLWRQFKGSTGFGLCPMCAETYFVSEEDTETLRYLAICRRCGKYFHKIPAHSLGGLTSTCPESHKREETEFCNSQSRVSDEEEESKVEDQDSDEEVPAQELQLSAPEESQEEREEESISSYEELCQRFGDLVVSEDQKPLLEEHLASGAGGTVWKGEYLNAAVAVKTIASSQQIHRIIREASVMCSIKHPHVVQMLGFYVEHDSVNLVMDLCGPSLFQTVHKIKRRFSEAELIAVFQQVAGAVSYLHSKQIIYRDLKSHNILWAVPGIYNRIKIADFGLSKVQDSTMTLSQGTYLWMAPEVLETCDYTTKADVYSFGCVMGELITMEYPYRHLVEEMKHLAPECQNSFLRSKILTGTSPFSLPQNLEPKVKEAIEACWMAERDRPTMAELFSFWKTRSQIYIPTTTEKSSILAATS